jgi:hypothetical protein
LPRNSHEFRGTNRKSLGLALVDDSTLRSYGLAVADPLSSDANEEPPWKT